jgi:hypothetical protein
MRRTVLATLALALPALALGPSALHAVDWPALRPEVSEAVRHDVSPSFRKLQLLKVASARPDREIVNKVPLDLAARFHPTPARPDPVVGGPATEATPAPSSTFEGLSDDDNAAVVGGRIVPPDTNGDVGLTQYVQTINLIFAVYDKATGARTFGPVPIKNLWAGFGGKCETDNDGDPTVLYDDVANRWVISQFAVGGDGHQCVAVSTTSDPAGSYYRYDFLVSPGRTNDYPKMGIWSDGYYVTINEFTSSFLGVIAVSFERSKMLLGQPAQMVKFGPLTCGTECYFSMQPAHFDGGTVPPAGAPAPLIQSWDDESWGTGTGPDGYRLFAFTVNWLSPGSSTLIALPQVNAPEFDAELCRFNRACIVQPAPGEKLDPSAQFTMYRAMYRNFGTHDSLVVNHTVDVTGRNQAGIRWAELRNTGGGWFLYQTGTVSPDKDNRWLGSIAMDKQGNIAVGYSVAGKSTRPSIRYATRAAGDPLGTMGSEITLQAGGGVQQSSSSRWGDYSSMSVDPSDGCTFWFTTEYYAASGSFDFNTRIGSFKQPGCN